MGSGGGPGSTVINTGDSVIGLIGWAFSSFNSVSSGLLSSSMVNVPSASDGTSREYVFR